MNNTKKISISELTKSKRYLSRTVSQNIKITEKSIRVSRQAFELFREREIYFFDSLYHTILYASISQADLSILTEKYSLQKRNYEKLLFARLIAMTVIEFIDDVNNLIGRDLLKDLTKNSLNEFLPDFKKINQDFSNVKKANGKMLKDIRNNASAHRSKDGLTLIDYVYGIDAEKVYRLGIDILLISGEIIVKTNLVLERVTMALDILSKSSKK